jgi:flavin-binding protein dodecin
MAKQPGVGSAVYKVVEVIGTSTHSWEDAAKNAVETAGHTLRVLRVERLLRRT